MAQTVSQPAVYANGLTSKEIYASVKKPVIIETVRLNRLCWFGHVQRVEENRITKRVIYIYKYGNNKIEW